jgi:hypothetical protein
MIGVEIVAMSDSAKWLRNLARNYADGVPGMTPSDHPAWDIANEVERLRMALGMCNVSDDGKHQWAMFPVETDGRLATGLVSEGTVGCFCQYCLIPKSPYHDEAR